MCMMCMILSPNCCTVTIFEYSSTDVTLLPSCLSVLSEHVASQSKWRSADLDLLKLAKKRKSVCSALFRGNVYIWSGKISKTTLLPMCGFIAQLVEHRTGIAEVMGSNPVEALIFFRLLSNCLNWKIYCDDHTSLSSHTAVQIWIISYIFHFINWVDNVN